MKVKEENETAGLKLNIQKTKIMASGPITSWQIDGGTMTDFIFLGFKTTSDSDCNHEMKRHLLLGRKSMTNLDSRLKSRNITLPTKVCLVKAMVFPVVIHGYESWNIKKTERRRIDAFGFCFFNLINFNLFILLYNIVLVLPYIDLNLPWVYVCSPPWTPLPPPSPSHPTGSSQCTSPEHTVSCIKPGELMLLNCGVGEGAWESVGLQGDLTSPS